MATNPHQVKLFPYTVNEVTPTANTPIPDSIWAMGAPILWSQFIMGYGARVGVIDTGIDNSHPDLAPRFLFRRDYVNDGATPSQFHPHGTHVAGTICASGQLKGVAPVTSIIDYRVLGLNGIGTYNAIVQAINDSVTDGCRIINMSLGGDFDSPQLHDAVKNAVANNVLVVVASGNDGPNTVNYPGFYPEVVSVGAVEFDASTGNITLPSSPWFSSSNSEVDVAADGWQVFSTVPGGGYAIFTGTSMATPHVTGYASLMLDKIRKVTRRYPTEDELYITLKRDTVDILTKGLDTTSGAGFVTAYPEIPKKNAGQWTLPNMVTGQP